MKLPRNSALSFLLAAILALAVFAVVMAHLAFIHPIVRDASVNATIAICRYFNLDGCP